MTMNHSAAWFKRSLSFFPPFASFGDEHGCVVGGENGVCGSSDRSSDGNSIGLCSMVALVVLAVFFALVVAEVLPVFRRLFLDSRGWSHRLFGGIHFVLLLLGALLCWIDATNDASKNHHAVLPSAQHQQQDQLQLNWWYDFLLGCSGILATLSAARDFPHRLVLNAPGRSGSLHETAIVTRAEMIEHSFYQGLNLLQALYLHALCDLGGGGENGEFSGTTGGDGVRDGSWTSTMYGWSEQILVCMSKAASERKIPRLLCLWMVTSPWLFRHRFPVHGFSQNWLSSSNEESSSTRVDSYSVTAATAAIATAAAAPNKTMTLGDESRRATHSSEISTTTKPSIRAGRGKTTKGSRDGRKETKGEGGEILLYRIKKAQYLFYKHVILHGLNISLALDEGSGGGDDRARPIPHGIHWRIFWLLLNTSYVMEFFLQTMVKRNVVSQAYMMILQKLLMTGATLSAVTVLLGWGGGGGSWKEDSALVVAAVVRPEVCLLSLVLNYVHRHHDVVNTMGIALLVWLLDEALRN